MGKKGAKKLFKTKFIWGFVIAALLLVATVQPVMACTNTDSGTQPVGRAAKLAFIQHPTNTIAGSHINPAVTVAVEDAYGHTVTGSNLAITVAIGNNPSGGKLSGTASVNAVKGVATFANLSIDKAGKGYTLKVSACGVTAATSNCFNVTAVTTTTQVVTTKTTTTTSVVTHPTTTTTPVVTTTADADPNSGFAIGQSLEIRQFLIRCMAAWPLDRSIGKASVNKFVSSRSYLAVLTLTFFSFMGSPQHIMSQVSSHPHGSSTIMDIPQTPHSYASPLATLFLVMVSFLAGICILHSLYLSD
jgi:hypothetical protein